MPSGRTPRPPGADKLGRRLAKVISERRNALDATPSALAVANEARISVDALRKIERGEIADPGFFTVVRLSRVLKLSTAEIERATLGRRR